MPCSCFANLAMAHSHSNRLQRTVMHEMPRHEGQRAAAEPGRCTCEDVTPRGFTVTPDGQKHGS
jgi:hypothetical protein